MKKAISTLLVLLFTGSQSFAITCDAGSHSHCVGGSGRGGGYRSTCTCVTDSCSYGYQTVPVGGMIFSYTQYTATVPDDCSNYAVQSQCVANNTLEPVPATFAGCSNSYPAPVDD